ncbi:MAG TPA: hypothetical protein VK859_14995, partial [bacterium]|nr:hypothetical protein [bacterium]
KLISQNAAVTNERTFQISDFAFKGRLLPRRFRPCNSFHFDNRKPNYKSISQENPPNLERFTTQFSTE